MLFLIIFSIFQHFYCETLIWSDEFDFLDETKWSHFVTTYPLGDFQYYRNNRANSWTSDGHLNIMPTLTAAEYGEDFLYSGCLDLTLEDPEYPCNIWWSQTTLCYDKAGQDIVKPIQLARLHTKNKFSFRFGRVEIRARLPLTDWIRPALWLMPENSTYGGFPASGEIDMMESSGNRGYHCGTQSRGVDTVQTNLHLGLPGTKVERSGDMMNPTPRRHWSNATLKTDENIDFAEQFRIYGLEWNENFLAFSVDGEEIYRLEAPGPNGGLFDLAGLDGDNIYKSGGPMAPFDQNFYLIISAQSGGWPFKDSCDPPAPWDSDSPTKRREFWEARDSWFSSWTQPFSIDYIRVYQ